jgi:hypothetical protein
MKTACRVLLIVVLATGFSASGERSRLPEKGVIPDEGTAVAVAEGVFRPVYGKDYIDKFLPYHAALQDGLWTVYGTLRPAGAHGGMAQLRIKRNQ